MTGIKVPPSVVNTAAVTSTTTTSTTTTTKLSTPKPNWSPQPNDIGAKHKAESSNSKENFTTNALSTFLPSAEVSGTIKTEDKLG